MDVTCSFQVNATVIANDFIDQYMAAANGEYVKVYLYILRHQHEQVNVRGIADALDHTEADVKRALVYWERLGALKAGFLEKETEEEAPSLRPVYSQEQVNRLAEDGDFTQLLYIAQQYMKKTFTPRECEVFAYLYDGLHMTAELLEYLVEYCVQAKHFSIRYMETVAISWHKKGLHTVEDAKSYCSGFTKNSFSVMRAFGLTDRKPGDAEREMIERWFDSYGFTREVVLEACNRTLEATHSPSFRYADKILSEWRKAGVKNLKDVAALDQKHQNRPAVRAARKPVNQFHNFEQRNTDYDSIVMDQVKSWIGES